MHFDNLQPSLNAPLPHLDDDDDEDEETVETAAAKKESSVSLLIQKRFLNQRKLFLWGPVTDESAKDLCEKLLYLESVAPGTEITFYMNTPGYDRPDSLSDQLDWLALAGFDARVAWEHRDLAVVVATITAS